MSDQTQSRCRRQRIRWRRRFGCEELEKNRNFCRKRATSLGEYLSPRDCVPCQTGQIFQYIYLVFVHSMVLAAKFCEEDREKKSIATEKAPDVRADIKGLWSVWVRRVFSLCRLFDDAAQGSHYDGLAVGHIVEVAVCQGKGTNVEG